MPAQQSRRALLPQQKPAGASRLPWASAAGLPWAARSQTGADASGPVAPHHICAFRGDLSRMHEQLIYSSRRSSTHDVSIHDEKHFFFHAHNIRRAASWKCIDIPLLYRYIYFCMSALCVGGQLSEARFRTCACRAAHQCWAASYIVGSVIIQITPGIYELFYKVRPFRPTLPYTVP